MDDLISHHVSEYDCEPEVIAEAPGVVNLMGEHTDYNEGYVLQIGLNRTIRVGISFRDDVSLRFFSADLGERKKTTIPNLKYKREDRWANYPKGVLYSLQRLGLELRGLNVTIQSDVPPGIGLGSSAALCVATMTAIRKLFSFDLTDIQAVQSSFSAESSFMNIETEITDHFVSTLAKAGTAMMLDLRNLEYGYTPVTLEDVKILVTNSNVPSATVEFDLQDRLDECRDCVKYLGRRKQGIALRDYSTDDLKASMGFVPESLRRICLHVVGENERVLEARQALKEKDLVALGKLMTRSHESLRDNYEVSCPEVDWLVKRATEITGVLGARMTGHGYGGCTVMLIENSAMDDYRERLDEYERIFGFSPVILECDPADGTRLIYPEN